MSEVERLREVLALAEKATAGEWEWWTSNSTRRLSVRHGRDGGVLHAYRASDGLADIAVSEADAETIAAAVNWLRTDAPALLARLEALEAKATEAKQEDFDHLTDCIRMCGVEETKAREVAIKLLYFVVNMKPKDPADTLTGREGAP